MSVSTKPVGSVEARSNAGHSTISRISQRNAFRGRGASMARLFGIDRTIDNLTSESIPGRFIGSGLWALRAVEKWLSNGAGGRGDVVWPASVDHPGRRSFPIKGIHDRE